MTHASSADIRSLLPSRWMNPLLDFELSRLNARYPGAVNGPAWRFLRSVIAAPRRRLLAVAMGGDQARARKWMERHAQVLDVFTRYVEASRSTGVQVSDYMRLYEFVRALRPAFVLECGTGLSTTALGLALRHNHTEHGIQGLCISMEEVPAWHEHAMALLPPELKPYVTILQSPRVERSFGKQTGVCYESVPDHAYGFVFVDGPNEMSPVSEAKRFDADLLNAVARNPGVHALIDHRLTTVHQLRLALATTHRVVFDPVADLGYVIPRESQGA